MRRSSRHKFRLSCLNGLWSCAVKNVLRAEPFVLQRRVVRGPGCELLRGQTGQPPSCARSSCICAACQRWSSSVAAVCKRLPSRRFLSFLNTAASIVSLPRKTNLSLRYAVTGVAIACSKVRSDVAVQATEKRGRESEPSCSFLGGGGQRRLNYFNLQTQSGTIQKKLIELLYLPELLHLLEIR